MHGLISDRLLKRFLKGIRRKSTIASANETEPMPESGAEMIDRSNCLENDQPEGMEAVKNIEMTDDVSKQNHRKGGSDLASGAARLPDDLQKTK